MNNKSQKNKQQRKGKSLYKQDINTEKMDILTNRDKFAAPKSALRD